MMLRSLFPWVGSLIVIIFSFKDAPSSCVTHLGLFFFLRTCWTTLVFDHFQDVPPPGSYDVQQSYELSQLHRERAKPRTDVASRKHGSFMSAASRFAPPRDVVIAAADLDNPGKTLAQLIEASSDALALLRQAYIIYSFNRPSSSSSTFSNIFFSETTGPIKVKFHAGPPWDGITKVCSNDLGQMAKMAVMPIWTASSEFGTYRLCEQRRFRRACASTQSCQNLHCSLIEAVSHEEPSDRKPDPWPLWMAGHAQLKFVMTECSKTQIRLTELI